MRVESAELDFQGQIGAGKKRTKHEKKKGTKGIEARPLEQSKCSIKLCPNSSYHICSINYKQQFSMLSYKRQPGGCQRPFCTDHLNQTSGYQCCTLSPNIEIFPGMKKEGIKT